MKHSIIKVDPNRKLAQGAYGETQGGVAQWFGHGTHIELHGRGVDGDRPYVYGTANGVCVRFYNQKQYGDNAYLMASMTPPTDAEYEERIVELQSQMP